MTPRYKSEWITPAARGAGAAALFLHGFPLNSFQWRGVIDRLTPERRCIAPDFLGMGASRAAPRHEVGPEAQADAPHNGPARLARAWGPDAGAAAARIAPFGRRADGRLVARVPFSGLAGADHRPGALLLVAVMLGSVGFDGLIRSSIWQALRADGERPNLPHPPALAAPQLATGGAYHRYQPLTKRGNDAVGAGFNDDPLWLVLAVAAYAKETGDLGILDEPVPYDNEPGSEAPLHEHLRRSVRYTLDRLGPPGLPLIGRAGWNDCLNLRAFSKTPGESFQTTENREGGVAESVFIAGLFVLAAGEMAAFADRCGRADEARGHRAAADRMAAETTTYPKAWFDAFPDATDATPLLAAARAVIDRSGLRGARMEDIAAEAGVARATVYRTFPGGRDELVAAVVERENVVLFGEIAAELTASRTPSSTHDQQLPMGRPGVPGGRSPEDRNTAGHDRNLERTREQALDEGLHARSLDRVRVVRTDLRRRDQTSSGYGGRVSTSGAYLLARRTPW